MPPKDSSASLKDNFWHQNIKTIIIALFGIIVLLYFVYKGESDNVKWVLSLVVSFIAGRGLK